jgi:hypothetical protein
LDRQDSSATADGGATGLPANFTLLETRTLRPVAMNSVGIGQKIHIRQTSARQNLQLESAAAACRSALASSHPPPPRIIV